MTEYKVHSPAFGSGTVEAIDEAHIRVRFETGTKKFGFPAAFDRFLSTDSPELLDLIDKRRKSIAEQLALQKSVPKPLPSETALPADPARPKPVTRTRKVSRAHVAFKCTYCDGGRSDDCIGFKGVCSYGNQLYNIEQAKHVWCSTGSLCASFLRGEVGKKALNTENLCTECRILLNWHCGSGGYQHGLKAGTGIKMQQVQRGSLAVLTTRLPHAKEEQRIIFGVYIVDESYGGDSTQEGFARCTSEWHIELKPREAAKLLFWNYYYCPKAPAKTVFGCGLFRYLDGDQALQILRDIIAVREDPQDRAFAEAFFDRFCELNGIDSPTVPPANGALKRHE